MEERVKAVNELQDNIIKLANKIAKVTIHNMNLLKEAKEPKDKASIIRQMEAMKEIHEGEIFVLRGLSEVCIDIIKQGGKNGWMGG